jgi:acetylornithine/N-succinyldiaminopimelate aminotransferase
MHFEDLKAREASHFIPVVNRHPVALVSGAGSRVKDIEGREYTDLMSGWGVTCIGHCHPVLAAAIAAQARTLMQTTNIFYTLPQLDLIDRLAELAPGSLNRSFLTNCGTEAVEGALKVAHRANKRPKFTSPHGAFPGRTLGALSVNGSAKHREPYSTLMHESVQIPFGDLGAAESAIDTQTCAIIVEPVQGEGGVQVPIDGYMTGLRKFCDATGAMLIADEVQTGIGRTGTMFGVEHEGVVPDIMTLGKGLGGGFPVAAFMVTEAVAETVQTGDHGTTFGGSPLACAAANAVLRVVDEEKLVERAANVGAKLQAHLQAFADANPEQAELVRGRGLLQGLVLRDAGRAATIPGRALEAGVIVNVTAGNVVRFFPPLNIPEDLLFEATDIVLGLA